MTVVPDSETEIVEFVVKPALLPGDHRIAVLYSSLKKPLLSEFNERLISSP